MRRTAVAAAIGAPFPSVTVFVVNVLDVIETVLVVAGPVAGTKYDTAPPNALPASPPLPPPAPPRRRRR